MVTEPSAVTDKRQRRGVPRGAWGAAVCLAVAAATPACSPAPADAHTTTPPVRARTAAPASAPLGDADPVSTLAGGFTRRYDAVQHGGLARAANAAITCRAPARAGAAPCAEARRGTAKSRGVNNDYDMLYSDVDRNPDTYNSTRAALRLPRGSRVTYARLYWGGNRVVGEVKPAKDNGRVLIAEPGGSYREVRADSVRSRAGADGSQAYQATADVTGLVRGSGPGAYTVAQLNVAKGRSAAGAWGGWTLVVAYENPREPRRHLTLWDGLAAPGAGDAATNTGTATDTGGATDTVAAAGTREDAKARRTTEPRPAVRAGTAPGAATQKATATAASTATGRATGTAAGTAVATGTAAAPPDGKGLTLTLPGLGLRPGGAGTIGVVGYDGDRGSARETFTAAAARHPGVALADRANPAHDTFNSTITDLGRETPGRQPAYRNTLGYDSDVLDARRALRAGGDALALRFAAGDDDYLLGVVFTQTAAAAG